MSNINVSLILSLIYGLQNYLKCVNNYINNKHFNKKQFVSMNNPLIRDQISHFIWYNTIYIYIYICKKKIYN